MTLGGLNESYRLIWMGMDLVETNTQFRKNSIRVILNKRELKDTALQIILTIMILGVKKN